MYKIIDLENYKLFQKWQLYSINNDLKIQFYIKTGSYINYYLNDKNVYAFFIYFMFFWLFFAAPARASNPPTEA